jgi:hypothetical protein
LVIDNGYRIDLLVEDLVVVEVKVVEAISPSASRSTAQLSSSGSFQARLLAELQRRAYA